VIVMAFDRACGSRLRRRLYGRGGPLLLPAALVLLWAAPGARAANRIYWGDCNSNVISFANLDGSGHGGDLKTTGVTPDCPTGTAMDLLGGKIYWDDLGGNTISFARLNNTGGGGHLKTTGASTPSGPTGVATDPAAGKIYWGNNLSGTLSFAELNNTGGGGDLSTSGATVSNPDGVAIDPATGKIYWTNFTNDTISFANLDGTGGGDLNTMGATVAHPSGVAIDPANKKIYWANYGDPSHPISFANLNDTGHGGNLDVSGATPEGAAGVAIDPEGGRIYWANNLVANTISFAKLDNTGGGGELKTTGASPPEGPGFPVLLKKPLATAGPKISGGSRVGSKLSCSKGKWAPDLLESFLYQRPVRFSYAWSRNGKRITGATKHSIIASHTGTYTCTVTAKNQAGSTKKTSASHKVT
jgi:DNA-binding beta-propeller fold protein YncE